MRHLLLISLLLLGASWAIAQNDPTPMTKSPSAQTTTGEETAPTSSGGNTSVQGCLSGSDGNYMLTDKNGQTYQLSGDTAKLSEHVGHEIKVTGSTSSMKASGGGTEGTMGPKHTLQVASIKHIAKTCQSGGTMSH